MRISVLQECFGGLGDGIQVCEVEMVKQSIFTVSLNGYLRDGHSRVVLRLISHVNLCVLQEKMLAYIPPHTSKTKLTNDRYS